MFYHYLRGNPYFAIMTVSIDQWHAGIGLFYGNAMFQLRYLTLIFVYPQYVKTYSVVYCFYLFLFFAFTV